MPHTCTGGGRPTGRRGARRLVPHRLVSALLLALAGCHDDATPTAVSGSAAVDQGHGVHVQLFADDGRLYVRWAGADAVAARLQWRAVDEPGWREIPVAPGETRAVLRQLEDERRYEVRVLTADGPSRSATATVGEALGCYRDGTHLYAGLLLLCSDADVARAIAAHPSWAGAPCPTGGAAFGEEPGNAGCTWWLDGREVALVRGGRGLDDLQPWESPVLVRRLLRRTLWGERDPWAIDESAMVTRRSGSGDAPDTLLVPGRAGIGARALLYPSPARPRGIAVWFEGHGGSGARIAADDIAWLRALGFRVVLQDMAMIGLNAEDQRPGRDTHFAYFRDRRDGVDAIATMLEPSKRLLDWVAATWPGEPILAIGRSGGGWTVNMVGALDARVTYAIAVNGSSPLSHRVRFLDEDMGDSEQFTPALYSVLGHGPIAAAAGRLGAVHVWSERDECCFRMPPDAPYLAQLAEAGRGTGRALRTLVQPGATVHGLLPATRDSLAVLMARVFPVR